MRALASLLLWSATLAPTAALADGPVLAVTAEPLGRSDDRTATRIESTLKMYTHDWMACWKEEGRTEPLVFLRQTLWFRSKDGTVRKAKVTTSTGDEVHDACGVALAAKIKLDPPPAYNDQIDLRVTWASPEALQP
jgi:hypothetical protein